MYYFQNKRFLCEQRFILVIVVNAIDFLQGAIFDHKVSFFDEFHVCIVMFEDVRIVNTRPKAAEDVLYTRLG